MAVNRREFLARSAAILPSALCTYSLGNHLNSARSEVRLQVALDPTRTLAIIPPNFIGLGYEISSVARPGLLSSANEVYVQLVKTLGKQGVMRIGGNTSDYASYSANGRPISLPENKGSSVVNDAVLRDLGTFLDSTGWQLIWGLNLGRGTRENAVQEAKAVAAAAKDHLLAFEIGNEPDLFSRQEVHRPSSYNYDAYLREYRAYRDALRKEIPGIAFAGPDAAVETDWVVNFARDEGKDIVLLTHHYYREGQNPTSTACKLLHPDPKLTPMLEKLRQASRSSSVPYRICETNSFSGGGKPGVSDTFAAALWVLDFMFSLAAAGCAGVNIETGVNQLGFISSYSPIGDDERGRYWATPQYYGMLAFAQSGQARMIGCTVETPESDIKAYAIQPADKRIVVTIINKGTVSNATILLDPSQFPFFRSASLYRLSAPSLESRTGVALGEEQVSAEGFWKPGRPEQLRKRANRWLVEVPCASAAILTFHS